MKLVIDNFEVEVKARKNYHSRASKQDTAYFLNAVTVIAALARDGQEKIDGGGLSDFCGRYCDDIYKALKAAGFYEKH